MQDKKDPLTYGSFSIPYYFEGKPNDNVQFDYNGETYIEHISAIQFYINQTGNESSLVRFGKKNLNFTDLLQKYQLQLRLLERNILKDTVIKL